MDTTSAQESDSCKAASHAEKYVWLKETKSMSMQIL